MNLSSTPSSLHATGKANNLHLISLCFWFLFIKKCLIHYPSLVLFVAEALSSTQKKILFEYTNTIMVHCTVGASPSLQFMIPLMPLVQTIWSYSNPEFWPTHFVCVIIKNREREREREREKGRERGISCMVPEGGRSSVKIFKSPWINWCVHSKYSVFRAIKTFFYKK